MCARTTTSVAAKHARADCADDAREGLFGIKADFKGLKVDPCIPKSWPGFTATRKYRGVEYQIEVKNPNGVCKGVKSVTVDGKKVAGNVIPYEAGKKTVKVEIPPDTSLVRLQVLDLAPDAAGLLAVLPDLRDPLTGSSYGKQILNRQPKPAPATPKH